MSRRRLTLLLSLAAVGGVTVVGLASLYFASQHVPKFYKEEIARRPEVQKKASDEMLKQATALASDVQQRNRWQALFTAEQINGWLAVDCREHFADLMPPEVHDPRIAIDERQATLGFRYTKAGVSTIFSFSFDVYLASPNVIAVHIQKARAGRVPVPLAEVISTIERAAEALDVPLQWRQEGGDPVALITLLPTRRSSKRALQLESVELHSGKVFLSGSSSPAAEMARRDPPKPLPPPVHEVSAPQDTSRARLAPPEPVEPDSPSAKPVEAAPDPLPLPLPEAGPATEKEPAAKSQPDTAGSAVNENLQP